MPVTGSRSTLYTGHVTANQIPLDVADDIINVELGMKNDESPLFVLTQKMGKKREVKNPRYDVFETNFNTRQGTASGVTTGSSQTIPVLVAGAFGSWLQKGSLLYVPRTGERILLAAAPTSTSLVSCVRNLGGIITGDGASTAEGDGIAFASGDILIHIGTANGEGATSTTAISVNTEQSYNYTQIEKTAVDITGTMMETELYGDSNPYGSEVKKQAIEHKSKMERSLWFGGRSVRQELTLGKAVRTFGGVIQHVQGNILDISGAAYGGVLTAKVLYEWVEMLFMNGGNTKTVFCSSKFAHACDQLLQNLVKVDDKTTSFGVVMKEFVSSSGRLLFVPHKKIFDMSTHLQGTAVALDMDYIRYVYLRNRDTKFYQGIINMRTGGYDGEKSEYLTEYGLEMVGYGLDNTNAAVTNTFRSVHGKLTGFSAY